MDSISKTRLYRIFAGMKQRCYNPNSQIYEWYGAKGVTICDEWMGEDGPSRFFEWALSNGYEEHLTIDRIDAEGPYSPDNCRWITQSENSARAKLGTSGSIHKRLKAAYPIVLTKGEKFIVVYVPDFDINTQGEDTADAMEMARDAIGLMGIDMEDDGDAIPSPSELGTIVNADLKL